MPPPPRPFRLVHRSFAWITFDPAKNDQVFERRGFDLAYVAWLYPGPSSPSRSGARGARARRRQPTPTLSR